MTWLAAVPAGVLAVAPARAADMTACTEATRACLTASAMTYIEGLQKGDGAGVRFAPHVRRTHNGGNKPEQGAEVLRARVSQERLTGHRNLRLTVDEKKGDVFAFWVTGGPMPQTAHIAERVRVAKGLITEIEVFVVLDQRPAAEAAPVWPDENPATAAAADTGPCATTRRDCMLAVANTYLDGLMVANAMAIAARQIATGDLPQAEERASLQALLGSPEEDLVALNRELASRIRAGTIGLGGPDADHVHLHLLRIAADRVAESNPKALARVQQSRSG